MIYFIISLIIIGLIFLISSIYTMPSEVRNSLSPQDIELIDEELKHRKQVGQLCLLSACLIAVFYIVD